MNKSFRGIDKINKMFYNKLTKGSCLSVRKRRRDFLSPFAFKEGLKMLKMDVLHIDLILDAVRYCAVALAVGYICPLLFKKIKL